MLVNVSYALNDLNSFRILKAIGPTLLNNEILAKRPWQ